MTNRLIRIVDRQLQNNGNKSLFYVTPDGRYVVEPSPRFIRDLFREWKTRKNPEVEPMADYAVQRVIESLLHANQFLNFSNRDIQELKGMYLQFALELVPLAKGADNAVREEADNAFREHDRKLREFLIRTNGQAIFAKYKENAYLFDVVCAQYSPEFQANTMGIAGFTLKEPILDIGCGKDANLVRFLRMNGFQAYGIDRSVETTEYTTKANWFEFSLQPNYWGTVFSHMAFSNHFGHHLLRRDGDYRSYMQKFIEILQSLKVGGTFIFSPTIPFLEKAMENDSNFRLVRYEEQTAAITRLHGVKGK